MADEVIAIIQRWKNNVRKILDTYTWTFILAHLKLLDLSIAFENISFCKRIK